MARIGVFNKEEDGWVGDFATLKLKLSGVEIIPNREKTSSTDDDRKPDWLMRLDRVIFGAGWNEKAQGSGKDYISLKITDPTVPNFPCRLFPNGDGTADLLA